MLLLQVFTGCPATKVVALAGDLSVPLLGLSDEDLATVVRSVSVVFHLAATVSFTEPMRVAVEQNVLAVRHLLEVARRLDNLAVGLQIL